MSGDTPMSELFSMNHPNVPISSQAVFPVNLFPMPDNDEARRTCVGSGRRCYRWYEASSLGGSWQKMCLAWLLMKADGYSMRYMPIWRMRTTKRSRRLWFQLAPSALRIFGIASGF